MDLEKLKADVAAAEAAEAAQSEPETEEVEEELEAESEEQTDEGEDNAETEEGEEAESDAKPEPEGWMQGDEQASQESAEVVDDSTAAKVRRKWKGRLKEEQDRVAKLEAELQELKKAPAPQAQQGSTLERPKREDFDSHDDPDAAYTEALADWKWQSRQAEADAKAKAEAAKKQQEQFQQKVGQEVDQHYERAVKLAERSGISPEMYQAADLKVRKTIDSIFTGAGDVITDALIANLGEGSERVFYNLGVNTNRLNELRSRLQDDPSGVKAAIYLGQLNAELKGSTKRTSNAPRPAPQVSGDARGPDNAKQLKKRYQDAIGKGNTQGAWEAKKAAKQKGVDTSNW